MMTRTVIAVMVGLTFLPSATFGQGKGNKNSERKTQGVPPGHMPAPGECRVWIDGRPPGQQPPPTDCRTAERNASRTRYARVIYGDRSAERPYRDDVYPDDRRADNPSDRANDDRPGRAVPRDGYPIYRDEAPARRTPEGGRYPNARQQDHPGWDTGYRDGLVKGREDVDKDRSYDPRRHQWYRSASRGYQSRYGLRGAYATVYREGFEAAYSEEFRRSGRVDRGR